MPTTDPMNRIVTFLERIGIPCQVAPVEDCSLLPGMTVRNGGLVYDPALPYPGDLLHEAGHIAVCDPELRPTLTEVSSEPGEELAAIAWSYAAALAADIDPALVFHEHGYRGGGAYLVDALAAEDGAPGVPMLQVYGMTALAKHAGALGLPVYPAMARWLR